jgi:hypothetical protein
MNDNVVNHTKNGEITYNKKTGEYKVFDETYSEVICITPYQLIAETALKIYGDTFLK